MARAGYDTPHPMTRGHGQAERHGGWRACNRRDAARAEIPVIRVENVTEPSARRFENGPRGGRVGVVTVAVWLSIHS